MGTLIFKILYELWQLPQHLLARLLIIMLDVSFDEKINFISKYKLRSNRLSSFSLGRYVFLKTEDHTTLKHEVGHSLQSELLGFLYLPLIGLPSVLGNLWDRLFHKSWTNKQRYK